jgi:hypothetical protein
MHLASDYIHPYEDAGGRLAYCRVHIYLPDETVESPVMICSEVPNKPGGSITNAAEVKAAGVIRTNWLPTPCVDRALDRGECGRRSRNVRSRAETFDLVFFSSYEVAERAPSLGETRAWTAEATWKDLDRATVEVLVGVGV